jgi:3-deoxy-7-phosphoheptulonate synthase
MNHLKLAKIDDRHTKTIVQAGPVMIGKDFCIIAGPCSVESEGQTLTVAEAVKKAGADMLRGGAFKPRSSPYSFQGLGLKGIKILAKAREITGLPVVSEVLDPRDVAWMAEYVDVLQIGTRNMQNFSLLKEVGKMRVPVLLKRGMYATIAEWLNCAEYILAEGNPHLILCERGIRTFETYTRNTLDLSAVSALKELTHLPVIVDPSHATGRLSLVEPMCMAAAAAGADGLMIEVHHQPEASFCDKDQCLGTGEFGRISKRIRALRSYLDAWGGTRDHKSQALGETGQSIEEYK